LTFNTQVFLWLKLFIATLNGWAAAFHARGALCGEASDTRLSRWFRQRRRSYLPVRCRKL